MVDGASVRTIARTWVEVTAPRKAPTMAMIAPSVLACFTPAASGPT